MRSVFVILTIWIVTLFFNEGAFSQTSDDILLDLDFKIEEVEKNAISGAMSKTLGNKAKAAEILGIPASTLKSKITKFNL